MIDRWWQFNMCIFQLLTLRMPVVSFCLGSSANPSQARAAGNQSFTKAAMTMFLNLISTSLQLQGWFIVIEFNIP